MTAVEVLTRGEDRSARSLDRLVAPRGVIVVGASRDPDKLGGAMAARLESFPGPVALVNARGGPGMHQRIGDAVAAVAASGGWADLAVLCIPAAACPEAVAECGREGVGAALVCAGGFSESGPEGAAVEVELRDRARAAGVRVVGPNTSGFVVPGQKLCASFVPGASTIAAGSVAVVAASGGLNHSLAFAFERAGVGLSLGLGVGAGIDVDAVDMLGYLADDPATSAIALHLESVADGPGLLEAVRRAAERKPVVAMVVGRHDVGEFAQSHTGALATSWRATRALLRQAGAVLVDRPDDMVVATATLAALRLAPGPAGVALVTAQAGPGLVVADALQEAGVDLPVLAPATTRTLATLLPPLTYQANPVDTGRPGPDHSAIIAAVAADPGIDLVAVYGLLEPVVDLSAAVQPVVSAGHAVVLGLDGHADAVATAVDEAVGAGLPAVVGPQALACAVAALVEDARVRPIPFVATAEPRPPALGPGPWDEAAAKDLLAGLGIRTPERRVSADRSSAHAALDELGGPVVVKTCDAAILHKSDVGGVHVGVRTHAELDDAIDAMAHLASARLLIERMVGAGPELIVGARRDPVFGPVVLVGIGGVGAEAYADVAIASVPAPREDLEGLAAQLRGRDLIEGFRGAAAVDRAELAVVVERLGAVLCANDHVAEIEINPLRVTAEGLVALDAVIIEGGRGDSDAPDA